MSTVTEKNKKPLLEVKGLKQYFPVSRKFTVKEVEDVSFYINPGETYGLSLIHIFRSPTLSPTDWIVASERRSSWEACSIRSFFRYCIGLAPYAWWKLRIKWDGL